MIEADYAGWRILIPDAAEAVVDPAPRVYFDNKPEVVAAKGTDETSPRWRQVTILETVINHDSERWRRDYDYLPTAAIEKAREMIRGRESRTPD